MMDEISNSGVVVVVWVEGAMTPQRSYIRGVAPPLSHSAWG